MNDQHIHVWYADIHQFKNQTQAESLLSASETERYERFLDQESKDEFLLGRYLLRTKLSLYENKILANEWEFEISRHGKPSILNPGLQNMHFSLSHSGGKVVCAFAKNTIVGIDIESNRKEKSYLALAERYFSPTEFQNLKNAKDDEQANLFFKYWALKEAYSKATGLGLQTSFDSFSFIIAADDNVQISLPDEKQNNLWKFFLLSTIENFQTALAVCSEKKIQVQEYFLKLAP